MTAPVGAVVKLYYDHDGPLDVGDGIETASGRCYLIVSARCQARGKHAGHRWHLRCLVVESFPIATVIYPLRWYSRGRRIELGK